jgi:hypothetical protein
MEMNHEGAWSWRSTRQGKRVLSDEEQAYLDRVTANKRRRLSGQSKRRKRADRKAIQAENDKPIF